MRAFSLPDPASLRREGAAINHGGVAVPSPRCLP
jgi:hypothetical protein